MSRVSQAERPLQAPTAQLLGDIRSDLGHADGVGVQVPAGDLASSEGASAGQKQGGIVVWPISG